MKFTRRTAGFAAFAATGLFLAACGSDGSAASGDGPQVLAAFYPLAYAAERVAGPDAGVTNLTQPGVEAHDLELTGRQVGEVASADLIVYLEGFQPAVDAAIDQNADGTALNVTDTLTLIEGSEDESDDHTDEAELNGDPHVWLDPTNMALIAETIADRLAEAVPEHADAFHDRAQELKEELEALDEEYSSLLADCERRVFVTSHAAFGYLAHRYDLEMVGIAGIDPDAEPSPARLAEVQRVVQDEGVTTIFYERLVSPAVAEALADDIGVETAVLDPIEGLTDDTADEDYFSLMRANLDALEEANGCA
ncbi:MAG TPA: metal ABC transporter substrate-binding protein [Jiangellaceae bacterium]|nr:metal ABC transporter substrate-binding protein [Jiangellaceae bacterium]